MYKDLIGVEQQVVSISAQREQNQKDGFFSLYEMNLSDYDCCYDNKLTEILMALDLDKVMVLQTIMYLGRDKDYNAELSPENFFLDYEKYIKSLGVKSKELEVNKMVGKMSLGEYLIEGYRILGIIL